jgi:YegS/Rv2252/BmrU family lipid kinase
MSICVIFNPAARGEKARHFRDQLAALSTQAALKPTYAAGSGRALAAEAVREGFDIVVAAGGDGTINEVLNGLYDSSQLTGKVRLGVIPLGTVNVFARELGLPADFEPAWRVIERGHELSIDLPESEFTLDGHIQRRCFAQLAGAGLDSRAIELVDWNQKKMIGPLAYVVAGFKALTEAKNQIVVSSPTAGATGELVLIGNGRFYGGSITLFPRASLQDGLLDVTVFPRVNWEVLLRCGWGWLRDQIHSAAGCNTFQVDTVTLSSNGFVPFELDGDNVGHLPARFSVKRGALRVIVP